MVAGKLSLHNSPVITTAVGIVGEDHHAVAGRRGADHEVVGVVIESPLPAAKRRSEFDAPAGAPGELVVDGPKRPPTSVVESQDVGQEASVVGRGSQERSRAVEGGFGISQTAVDHAERSKDAFVGEPVDGNATPPLQVLLQQDESLARVAPTSSRWTQWLERLTFRAPVGKTRRMREHMADRDVGEDRLIEVLHELERQVSQDLPHERCRVHRLSMAIGPNEFPVAHNADRPAHPEHVRPDDARSLVAGSGAEHRPPVRALPAGGRVPDTPSPDIPSPTPRIEIQDSALSLMASKVVRMPCFAQSLRLAISCGALSPNIFSKKAQPS